MERQKYAKEFDIHLTIWIKILWEEWHGQGKSSASDTAEDQ